MTVTVYDPSEPEHDRVDVVVCPLVSVMLVGFRVHDRPDPGTTAQARFTVPLNPLRLETVIVDEATARG